MPKLTEVPVSPAANDAEPQLIRGVGLWGATTLNMIDMIGVGPFITIPLIIAAMGGPQAMLGWILGALLVVCDGLVWAELGAALPGSGGSYRYLAEMYGARKLGRLMSFLFIWQLTISAPLSIASGSIGLARFVTYIFRRLGHETKVTLPILGSVEINAIPVALVAIAAVGLAVFLLYRRITLIERLSKFLWVGVMLTILWVITAGVTHFDPKLAFDFPPGPFTFRPEFFTGLGAALLVSSGLPFEAARDGNYFRIFAKVPPRHRFPYVSLLVMGGIATLFCFFRLADVIAALVVIRILVQFLAQIVGVIVLRVRRPDLPRPFRMWLYQLPALVALGGFIYVLISRKNFLKERRYAAILVVVGLTIYFIRSRLRR